MDRRLVIAERFCGPAQIGNGGYVSGLLAQYVDGTAQVTLRVPPPLATPMRVDEVDGRVAMFAGDVLVAEAEPTEVPLEAAAAVSFDVATDAAKGFAGRREHPFPTCFVCGPLSHAGLRIFPGQVVDRELVAAPWTPADEFADAEGAVLPQFVSAALDCAGAWSLEQSPARPFVLGRLAVRQDAAVPAGVPLVVAGWATGVDGRKRYAGTALYDEAGTALAVATATWIELRL